MNAKPRVVRDKRKKQGAASQSSRPLILLEARSFGAYRHATRVFAYRTARRAVDHCRVRVLRGKLRVVR